MEKVSDSLKPKANGCCVLCTAKASTACQRCGDFYCSKECQLRDWQRHRYICFAIPALVRPMDCSAFSAVESTAVASSYQEEISSLVESMTVGMIDQTKSQANKPQFSAMESTPKASSYQEEKSFLVDSVIGGMIDQTKSQANKSEAKLTEEIAPSISCNGSKSDKNINPSADAKIDNGAGTVPAGESNNNINIGSDNSISKKTDLNLSHPPNAEVPPSGSVVYITEFSSANYCFVRDGRKSAAAAYFSLCEKVNTIGPTLPKLVRPLLFGYGLVKYNGRLQRVKALHPRGNGRMRLLFIDLGIVDERKKWVEIRTINSELLELPCHSWQVQLKDVPNYALDNETRQFLQQFVGNPFVVTYDSNGNVDLLNAETRILLNTSIRQACSDMKIYDGKSPRSSITAKAGAHINTKDAQLAKDESGLINKVKADNNATEKKANFASKDTQEIASQGSNIITKPNVVPMMNPPFEMRRLRVNSKEGIDVFVVDNSSVSRGIIGAFDNTNARDFSDLHSRLSQFKDSQPYKPVLNEYVIAKFDSSWYRAKVLEIRPNRDEYMYTVMYIEFSNAATVSYQDIRRYPADLSVPCHTSICLIEGFPHRLNQAQKNFLEEKLQMNSVLHVDSVSYLHDMAMIQCTSLIDGLNKYQ